MGEWMDGWTYIEWVTNSISNGNSLQIHIDFWLLHVLHVHLVAYGRGILSSVGLR